MSWKNKMMNILSDGRWNPSTETKKTQKKQNRRTWRHKANVLKVVKCVNIVLNNKGTLNISGPHLLLNSSSSRIWCRSQTLRCWRTAKTYFVPAHKRAEVLAGRLGFTSAVRCRLTFCLSFRGGRLCCSSHCSWRPWRASQKDQGLTLLMFLMFCICVRVLIFCRKIW